MQRIEPHDGHLNFQIDIMLRTAAARDSEGEVKMANSSAKEKYNKPQPANCCQGKRDCLNYCVSGMLSRCGAGPEWQEQKKCKYFKKSTIGDRCMHYIEALDGHCDCVDAQREVRRRLNSKDNCK